MTPPSLVIYLTSSEYLEHYKQHYCRNVITTFDSIRVYFSPERFGHAFYEGSPMQKGKFSFSRSRAERIDWIRPTLASPDAALYTGYISATDSYDPSRRVAALFDEFVVIINLSVGKNDEIKGQFNTCFIADASIDKIRQAPLWTKDACIEAHKQNGR